MNVPSLGIPLFSLFLFVAACERSSAPSQTKAASDTRSLTRVQRRDQVCMVNDQFMGRSQIPVEIGGRTYFGCCAMCKGRLEQERAARVGIDPISGREVDKSIAVLAQDSAGKIYYFENEANLTRYSSQTL